MKKLPRALMALGGVTLALVPISVAIAYSVQPMIYRLTPTGSRATQRLSITNTRSEQLNVEIQPFSVTADQTGRRTLTPAPNDFLIFPPQASIAGDRTQVMQVRYVGSPNLATGRVYILRVKQTNTTDLIRPDATAPAQSQLALALNFNTTAIVQPQQMQAATTVITDLHADDQGVLHAQIRNAGPGVADLSTLRWSITRDGRSEDLPLDKVRYGDAVFLEAGATRDITLVPEVRGPAQLAVAQSDESRANARR